MSGGPAARRRRTVLYTAAGVALAVLCLVAVLATRPAAQDTLEASPLVGKPAPAIVAPSLSGATISLSSYRGRYVVVNFFASWCPPCQQETPQLLEFVGHQPGARGAAVLGVVFADSASNAEGFARSNGVKWPIVTDAGGQVALAYGVSDPPASFLVAPDGRVVAEVVGGVTAQGLDQLITEARTEDP